MTREEAIKIIDCYDIGFYDLSGEKIPADKLAKAFDMAIDALQTEAVKHTTMRLLIESQIWKNEVLYRWCGVRIAVTTRTEWLDIVGK